MTSTAGETMSKSIVPLKVLIVILILLTSINLYLLIPKTHESEFRETPCNFPEKHMNYQLNDKSMNAGKVLLSVLKHINVAHRHSRSSKTLLELSLAHRQLLPLFTKLMDKARKDSINMELSNNMYLNPSSSPEPAGMLDVCPDKWTFPKLAMSLVGGYVRNCHGITVAPIESVISLLLNLEKYVEKKAVDTIVGGIFNSMYSKIPIIITTDNPDASHWTFSSPADGQITILHYYEKKTLGQRISEAASKISTKYVLVGRDIEYVNDQFSIDRLLMMLSFIGADFVGGSHRSGDGHFELGCYQMLVKNYTMNLIAGYDLSHKSCMYCDYLSGPFAVRTALLQNLVDPRIDGEAVFADMWFRQRDQMGLIDLTRTFDKIGVHYELAAGTNLGAVKLGTTLPFDIDHDIHIQARNASALTDVRHWLNTMGYRDHNTRPPFTEQCLKNMERNRSARIICGQFNLRPHPQYQIECMGISITRNERELGKYGLNFTRINFAGYWMVSQPNPAAHSRNMYGDDIFRHVEHWRNLKVSPYIKYSSLPFSGCPVPGFHGCVKNNFVETGNLQFKDMWL